jgi:hypothetical protein
VDICFDGTWWHVNKNDELNIDGKVSFKLDLYFLNLIKYLEYCKK